MCLMLPSPERGQFRATVHVRLSSVLLYRRTTDAEALVVYSLRKTPWVGVFAPTASQALDAGVS